HEDFTGQYSKSFLAYSRTAWFREEVSMNQEEAASLGFRTVPDLKKAVARGIREYVEKGGFL
ncbi:MAG TPA: asparagine synthetase B, partial [Gemmatimonadetes bacterium]|nr:asparagine synthetase B [Gemmatimonadota bacterium]